MPGLPAIPAVPALPVIGLPEGLPFASLCKFPLPALPPLPFEIPAIPPMPAFPPKIPPFAIPALPGLNCAALNPLAFSEGVEDGGGRVMNVLPDPDDDFNL